MQRQYFVDTWFLIAQFDAADAHHAAARAIQRRLRDDRCVTHDGVLSEMLTTFSDEGARVRQSAARLVERLLATWVVIETNRTLFRRALAHYANRPDEDYSLVDCMSMVVMRDRGITHVLTNDHHFRQEGFTVVSE